MKPSDENLLPLWSILSLLSLLKLFFSESLWLYICLKSQKTLPGYYFNNNNCYNRIFVHIIRTIILNCTWQMAEFSRQKFFLLNPQRCAIWSILKVCHWKCMEFYSLLLSLSTRKPKFIYKVHVCKLNWLVQVSCQ